MSKRYSTELKFLMNPVFTVGNTNEILGKNMELYTKEFCTSKMRLMSPYYLTGELLFNLAFSQDLDFIAHYASFWKTITPKHGLVRSAYWWQAKYGHGFDQIKYVIKKLTADPNSRQAVIHLKRPIEYYGKDEICTLTVQFFIRDNKLKMVVNMRSNDIIRGLPYDHAVFVLLQHYIARQLNVEADCFYYHNAASFHLYHSDLDKINKDELNSDASYPFEITNEFFEESDHLVYFEYLCRKNTFDICHGIEYINEHFKDSLAKTMAAILLMYKKPHGDKLKIFDECLNDVECGLKDLLIDYQNNLRSKK